MRINWDVFFENSSTEEALIDFLEEHSTFEQFSKACWPKECKRAIKELRRRGYKKARRAAGEALNRRGYN